MLVRIRSFRLTLGFALAAATTASIAAQGPDPRSNYIESITYGGSGCANGTVAMSISGDRTAATLIFDELVASIGPGVPPSESIRHCQITVNVNKPRGVSLYEMTIDYRGYHYVSAGLAATASASYDGAKQIDSTDETSNGPAAHDYFKQDTLRQHDRAATTLTIDAQSEVGGTAQAHAQAQATVDSIDIRIR